MEITAAQDLSVCGIHKLQSVGLRRIGFLLQVNAGVRDSASGHCGGSLHWFLLSGGLQAAYHGAAQEYAQAVAR